MQRVHLENAVITARIERSARQHERPNNHVEWVHQCVVKCVLRLIRSDWPKLRVILDRCSMSHWINCHASLSFSSSCQTERLLAPRDAAHRLNKSLSSVLLVLLVL